MRIDHTHKRWFGATVMLCALAIAVYVYCTRAGISTPGGGSALGLTLGIAGYALMLIAALLGLRKKFPIRRIGRASTWMRAHLWLGFLSLPLLVLHSGFSANGSLTAWLMILLIITVATGLIGAAIQHYLPKLMTRLVPLETIYEEIPRVRVQLQREADELMACLPGAETSGFAWNARPAKSGRIAEAEIEPELVEQLREVYAETIRPFLSDPDVVKNHCADRERSASLFTSLRTYAPEPVHKIVAGLEHICEEERQLNRQKQIYRWLHGWLLVHVPLSLALILLGAIHAIVALGY
jgi:hypothetical protein